MSATTTNPLELGQPEVEVKKVAEDDLHLWSVTTIIGVLDKPALMYWVAGLAADAALDYPDVWQPMASHDRAEAWKWLRDARFRPAAGVMSDTSFGSAIHTAAEEYALTGVRPDIGEVMQAQHSKDRPKDKVAVCDEDRALGVRCLDNFDEWLNAFQPEYMATEVAVYSERHRYAGTCDAFLKLDGVPLIVDYKSSKKSYGADGKPSTIYPETSLQLAAYRFAELAAVWRPRIHTQFRRRYYVLGPGEREQAVPVPEVHGGLGIKITPDFVHARPVECDEKVWHAFLHLIDVAGFQFNDASFVVGEPLVPPVRAS